MRHIGFLLAVLCSSGAGCKKSEPTPAPASKDTVAHIRWIGKRALAADTNSHDLMAIWNVPAGLKLEAQTLDKLSTAPWRLLGIEDRGLKMEDGTNTTVSAAAPSSTLNHPSWPQKLRPLLDDVLQEESYVEVHSTTNGPGDVVFAIRLPAERARLWQTNLPIVLKSLGGSPAEPGGSSLWKVGLGTAKCLLNSRRVGDWTLLTFDLEPGSGNAPNALVDAMVKRIQTSGLPFTPSPTNYWIDLHVNLPRVARALGIGGELPAMTPTVSLKVTGNGEFVRTLGEFDFPQPLGLALEPWNIPTNLMHGDITTFTAVRGVKSWLDSSAIWKRLQLGPAPNQAVFWGVSGLPARFYVAAPVANASNRVAELTDLALKKAGTWFPDSDLAGFQRSTQFDGLEWKGIPYLYPFLTSETNREGGLIFGGTVFTKGDDTPPALAPMHGLLDHTNQVYYDREFTGGQIEQWIYAGQFIRYTLGKKQLPDASAGLLWLKAIEPITGSSATDITQTGPAQLTLARTSGSGFSALELNLLVDWLESPQFPLGLNSLAAPKGE